MGLRERLVDRPRPVLMVPIKTVEDTTEAQRAVDEATEQHRFAQLLAADGKNGDVRTAKKALDKAQAALAACFESVPVRALRPKDYEALVADHPAPKDSDEVWDRVKFPRALFLECVEGDMSREEWETWLDESASDGERQALYLAALQVNNRPPDESVPKG